MTKSIIITFNEADEGFLMPLFKRLKIKIQATTSTKQVEQEDRVPTKEEFLSDLRESVAEMHAHMRGEIKLQSVEDFLKELKAESTGV